MSPGARVAVLTSGGDAPGMGAAVWGVVMAARAAGAEVLGVVDGWAGLIAGQVRPLDRVAVAGWQARGGTPLGTARSAEFRDVAGRRRAVATLLAEGVGRLVVIGGDGSLAGALALHREWAEHVQAVAPGASPTELRLVGLVGSIDDDLVLPGVEASETLGWDSALHRLAAVADALHSTADSHRRTFVVEVMGRRCGSLAVAAGLVAEAAAVVVPEVRSADWREALLAAIDAGPAARHHLVMVSEGAEDAAGEPVGAEQVRALLQSARGLEARVTVPGHVQRGGPPSARDRLAGTLLGLAAGRRVVEDGPPELGVLHGASVGWVALDAAVRATREASPGPAVRSAAFRRRLEALTVRPHRGSALRVALVHHGAPSPGMNAAVHAFGRLAPRHGVEAWACEDGLTGLAGPEALVALTPSRVAGLVGLGGATLGSHRATAGWEALERAVQVRGLHGLVVVGGYEGLEVAARLGRLLPVALVPATVSNNVPGTDRSLGCDSALGVLLEAVDRLRASAGGARRRVFVLEAQGRRCGWLATAVALGAEADAVFTHEEGVTLATLGRLADRLVAAFDSGRQTGLVVVADGASPAWTAATVASVLEAEARGRFSTRLCVPGHLQQGATPSPGDRLLAVDLVHEALRWLAAGGSGGVVVGVEGVGPRVRPVHEVLALADGGHRRPLLPPQAELTSRLAEVHGP